PVTAGTVQALFDLPTDGSSPFNNDKTISLTYDPASKTWKGSLKIQKDNVTGDWSIKVSAADNFGNTGEKSTTIKVFPGVLVVSTVKDPAASVPRASWVTWQVKVTYEGDGSLVDLNIPGCTVYVVNATTNAIVSSGYIIKVSTGYYNISWFVPADAPLGSYKFMIPKNGLNDTVDPAKSVSRNVGPKAVVYSAPFSVGITALNVVVDTYSADKDVTSVRKAFSPGSTVYIGASITYKDSGVVMSSGSVRAYIYNSTGGLVAETLMTFDSGTRMWWCSWSSSGAKAGRYTVVVKARDVGNNIGEGSTYFLIAGVTVTPSRGTVPPEKSVTAKALDAAKTMYLVQASIFTVSGKSLGTSVTLTGTGFTPKSKVNVTVSGLPYLSGKTVYLAVDVPTDDAGAFTCSFVFPVAPNGTYTLTIRDAVGVTHTARFTVVPGIILTPGVVVGSAMINVIGTGYPADATGQAMLLNGTDALYPIVSSQLVKWTTNLNGTLTSSTAWTDVKATPAFTLPYMEPGTYIVALYMKNTTSPLRFASDTVRVVNAFKDLTAIVTKIDDLAALVRSVNVTLVGVSRNVATLITDSGIVKADLSTLKTMLTRMNATLVSISGGVATISTSVGTIRSSVDALSPKVTSIEGKVATIETAVGTIKGEVESIDGNVATVKTDVGTIKADVSSVKSDLSSVKAGVSSIEDTVSDVPAAVGNVSIAVWIAVVLSLVAAIGSIISLVLLRRKIA
ncbi:MAG: hypothetical protein N3F10_07685, partial [Candidatus Bathyarchaeota archaeon]|nr:hypothetical protein [Candidatus Bathyarchaeota archaeon]